MTLPKVSIIIPIFGVEQYIERCARSLFEQTIDELEYLFIDDCTPDKSIDILKKILEDYPNRQRQVRIIKMLSNCGQAKVRKRGIELATGEYIIHCDGDDWIEPEMYELMYKIAKKKDLDIVVCDFNMHNGATVIREYKQMISNDKLIIIKDLINGKLQRSLSNKLVKRKLYTDVVYPVGNLCEDLCLSIQLMYKASQFSHIPFCGYNYYMNLNSTSRLKTVDRIYNRYLQVKPNYNLIVDFLSERNLLEVCKHDLINFKLKTRLDLCDIAMGAGYHLWSNTYPELTLKDIIYSDLDIRSKIKLLLTYFRLYPIKYYKD